MVRQVFLAWQDPVGRSWYPIGTLTFDGSLYRFAYTVGADEAQQTAGFRPLAAFPNLRTPYESPEMFPFFANRVLMSSRPDYDTFVSYMALPRNGGNPLELLARSGGRRVTDSYEVFPRPDLANDEKYRITFFAHGLRHLAESSRKRLTCLAPNERLLLMHDLQNEHDRHALLLRTNGGRSDWSVVGYLPRYLAVDLVEAVRSNPDKVEVCVERLNPEPAPLQLRLLCRLEVAADSGWQPFSEDRFRPLCPMGS